MLRAQSSGNEQHGRLGFDIGGVPAAWRVDRIFVRADCDAGSRTIRKFLMQRYLPRKTKHHFVAQRVHLPTVPAFGKAVHRDQAAFRSIGIVAFAISLILIHSGKGRLRYRSRAKTEMKRIFEQIRHREFPPFFP